MYPHYLFLALAGIMFVVAAYLGVRARWGSVSPSHLAIRIAGPAVLIVLYIAFFVPNLPFRAWLLGLLSTMANGFRSCVDSWLPLC
jgi:hypothetical protein